jgi:hypothetical protein
VKPPRENPKKPAVAIDLRRAGPTAEHEIDQSLDVGRAIGQRRQGVLVVAFGAAAAVAWMIDSRDDETSIGQASATSR